LAVVTVDRDTAEVLCIMPHIFIHAEHAGMQYVYGFHDDSVTAAVEE
jgi:hypothetical protein